MLKQELREWCFQHNSASVFLNDCETMNCFLHFLGALRLFSKIFSRTRIRGIWLFYRFETAVMWCSGKSVSGKSLFLADKSNWTLWNIETGIRQMCSIVQKPVEGLLVPLERKRRRKINICLPLSQACPSPFKLSELCFCVDRMGISQWTNHLAFNSSENIPEFGGLEKSPYFTDTQFRRTVRFCYMVSEDKTNRNLNGKNTD